MKKLIVLISLVIVSLATAVTIQEINGARSNGNYYVSPYKDKAVYNVEGIVTAKKFFKSGTTIKMGGFYMQSVTPDNDPRTSEGVLVYLPSSFTGSVEVGDKVKVGGLLKEYGYVPADGNALELTIREISSSSAVPLTVEYISSGNPVVATKIGTKVDPANPNKRLIPTERIFDTDLSETITFPNGQTNLFDTLSTTVAKPFNPATNGLDFWRSMQGMLVEIDNPLFCAPTYYTVSGTKKTTDYLVADNGEGASIMNARGGITVRLQDRNAEMIAIETTMFPNWINNSLPDVQTGDKINGSFKAVVDYSYGAFKLLYTDSTQLAQNLVIPANLPKEVTPLTATTDRLTVSSFNVENLNPTDDQIKFDNLALGIINNLKNPDIIGIEEIQDNNGTTNDGTVAANETYAKLLAAISAQGGPTYDYRQVDPVNGFDGGQPGGNIRVGFLFNPARVQFVDRAPGANNPATDAVTVVNNGGVPELSWSPARVSPAVTETDSAWAATRKPLVGEFTFGGKKVFICVNHFSSKGGDKQKFMGRYQSPYLYSEKARMQQAAKVAEFFQQVLAIDPNANVIGLGDWNDFQFSNPLRKLTGDDTGTRFMYPLDELLPENERYAYVYAGNSQALDHILVSKNIWDGAPEFDVVHINAEYKNDNRLSDHDPEVARLSLMGVGIEDDFVAAKSMKMTSYPNPFNPSTTISFALVKSANVELAIYNTVGEKVATLVNGAMNQGVNSIVWNAAKFNSGIYYAQLSVDNKMIQTSKMMLVK